jgi:uncharacterized membrane protein YhaH (DUF805 family)
LNAYFDAMRRYFDFKGRSTRGQFWLFTLAFVIMALVAWVLDSSLLGSSPEEPGFFRPALYLTHFVPSLAVNVRRLHDTDRSGWWVLVGIIPIFGQVMMIIWLCAGSTPGANRFGDQPSAAGSTPALVPRHEPQTASTGVDLDRLEKLAALRASGAIDEQEYQNLKSDIISVRSEVRL